MAIKLLKFGATWCQACKEMDRAETLEKFSQAHPDVKVEKIDLVDEPKTAKAKAANALADRLDVKHIPEVFFVNADLLAELDLDTDEPIEPGERKKLVLAHKDEVVDVAGLEKLYQRALKKG